MQMGVSKILLVAGGAGVAGSLLWWHAFYTEVSQFLGATGPLPTECIYTLGGTCGMITGAANAMGAQAYDPKLFWGSVAAFVIGAILNIMPDGNEKVGYHSQQSQRKDDPSL
jgi:hypothetical protein